MNCQQAQPQLPEFAYGDTEPKVAQQIAAHVMGCPACQRELADLRRLRDMLDSVPAVTVPLDMARLCARAADEKPSTPALAKQRSERTQVSYAMLIIFGVLLPAVTLGIEYATGMCAEVFFDPIPTTWHAVLAAFVPIANIFALLVVINEWTEYRTKLAIVNGVAVGISLVYALVFAPLLPVAIPAILLGGMGFLPLAPLSALVCGLVLQRRLISLPNSPALRFGGMLFTGGTLGVLMVVSAEIPMLMTQTGAQMAVSTNPATRAEGLAFLRRFGSETELLQLAYGDRNRAVMRVSSLIGSSITTEEARVTYYRLTGHPFNSIPPPERTRRNLDEFLGDIDFDQDLGGVNVAARVRDLHLTSSRLDGFVDAGALWAYVEWTMEFKNSSRSPQEARAQIQLPPGAVVSRLTLWVNGEPREAAFAGTSVVREAYQKVAVVQRRDPVLVTWAGIDRVMMQCFPVPPAGGLMKVRVGMTIPLPPQEPKLACLRLPRLVERNFGISDELVHAIWLDTTAPATTDAGSLTSQSNGDKGWTLRGSLPDDLLLASTSTLSFPLARTPPTVWAEDPKTSGQIVSQSITESRASAVNSLSIVVDGSVGMKEHWQAIATAIASLPPDTDVKLFVAADSVLDRTAEMSDRSVDRLADLLSSVGGIGGCDNVPGLIAGWEAAAEATKGVVVWIHAAQPVLLDPVEPLIQRLERRPDQVIIYDVEVASLPNRVGEALKSNAAVRAVPRFGSLESDLRHLFEQITGVAPSFSLERAAMAPSEVPADAKKTSEQIVKLWAFGEVNHLFQSPQPGQTEQAVPIAVRYQLVTPVSGAVVLETQQQYDEAGLKPVDPDTVPTVPEPEVWFLIGIAIAVIGWEVQRLRRWRGSLS